MRFIKGKWYLYDYQKEKELGFYMKCRENHDTILKYSEYISVANRKHSYSNNFYKNKYVTDKLIPQEELSKYLPKDHPDLKRLNEEVCYEIY